MKDNLIYYIRLYNYKMTLETEFTFRVIKHYTNGRSPIYLRFRAPLSITPEEFIHKILHDMTQESLMNIYKLNITQYCENVTQVLPFIEECQGEIDIHNPNHLSSLFDSIRRNLLNEN